MPSWMNGAGLVFVGSLLASAASADGLPTFPAPVAVEVGQTVDPKRPAPAVRRFRLDYGGTLEQLPVGARVRVWLPVPASNADQTVTSLARKLPAEGRETRDRVYGNTILYFEATAPESGTIAFQTSYGVTRREVRAPLDARDRGELRSDVSRRFLQPNSKVPLKGPQLTLLDDVRETDGLALARTIYDRVDKHVKYDKSRPGYGNGDVLWVCDSRFGNCTDFHSLFISLARSRGIPARFEIGFPLPPERGAGKIGGYHCWASFHTRTKGWVPVDISEADKHPDLREYYFGNLTENRVSFSVGRDIVLNPPQNGGPLNYFVYPYAEVTGKSLGREHIKPVFTWQDMPTDR